MNRRAFLLSIPAVAVAAVASQSKPALRVWQTDYISMEESFQEDVCIWGDRMFFTSGSGFVTLSPASGDVTIDSAKAKVVGLL